MVEAVVAAHGVAVATVALLLFHGNRPQDNQDGNGPWNNGGFGHRGPHGPPPFHGNRPQDNQDGMGHGPWNNGGFGGCGMNKHMKNKIGYFMRQMFGDQAMHNSGETGKGTPAWGDGTNPMCQRGGNQEGEFVARRNPKRAIPISHPGQKVHVACPGDELMIELVFRNGGMHKYH